MKTNPRIDRLTREALGDTRADDVKSSVASIEVMVVAMLMLVAVAAGYSIDIPESSPKVARIAPAAGHIEVGHSRPVLLEPASEGNRGSHHQTDHTRR